MAKKKVILFIVEGINDKTCLESVLGKIIDSNEVKFQITDGDITSKYGMDESKIKNEVGVVVKTFKDKYHLSAEHFMEVVHIIDTDGAFIDDSMISVGDVDKTMYYDTGIVTSCIDNISSRNKQKSEVVKRMVSITKVLKSVPYSVYYFSSNMDHVLHNDANMSKEEKDDAADDFDDKYADDPEGFLTLICDSDFSVNGTYKESWDFIQIGNNSVCRHSNFAIYLSAYR
ncbi:MAG: hypothetical protein MJZ11_06775 [Lachnospiraceae bacterium]|nr:hypothetical protein [Lachnospiraceae bacterium]